MLRAVAVLLILVSHADIAQVQGGAHVLLAVAGYNLARFQLALAAAVRDRVRGILRSAADGRGPSLRSGSAAVALATGDYRWQTALFLNGFTGSDRWSDDWQFWFLEALVWCYLGVAALVAVPWVAPVVAALALRVAMAVVAGALALRYALVGVEAGAVERYEAVVVLWCLALGWAAAAADTTARRLLVAARRGCRDGRVLRRPPARAHRGRRRDAAAGRPGGSRAPPGRAGACRSWRPRSLWIYLTQWQVYPGIEDAGHPYLAVVVALAVGIGAHAGLRAGQPQSARADGVGRPGGVPLRRPASLTHQQCVELGAEQPVDHVGDPPGRDARRQRPPAAQLLDQLGSRLRTLAVVPDPHLARRQRRRARRQPRRERAVRWPPATAPHPRRA